MKTDIEGVSVAPASNSFELSRASRENSFSKVKLKTGEYFPLFITCTNYSLRLCLIVILGKKRLFIIFCLLSYFTITATDVF
jgi:hypothetical protein